MSIHGSNQPRSAAWGPSSEEKIGGMISPMTNKVYDEEQTSEKILTFAGDQIVVARPESMRSSYTPLPPPGDTISPDSHVLTLTSCFRAKMVGTLQEMGTRSPQPRRASFTGSQTGSSQSQLPRSSTEWSPDSTLLQLTTSFRAKMAGNIQSSPIMKGDKYSSPQQRDWKDRKSGSGGRSLSPNTLDEGRSPEVFQRLFNLHKRNPSIDKQKEQDRLQRLNKLSPVGSKPNDFQHDNENKDEKKTKTKKFLKLFPFRQGGGKKRNKKEKSNQQEEDKEKKRN